jgi:hypothetical protein
MTAGRHNISKIKNWCTPIKYVNAIKKVFNGEIELDPCSNEFSIVNAKIEFMLPKINGLDQEWNYKTIYVNPPYGKDIINNTTIKHWMKKIVESFEKYHSEIIALIPVATNTSHWKEYIYPKANGISFLYDTRLKFNINGNEDTKGAPMACCCVYYGYNINTFIKVFSNFGATISFENIYYPI